MDSSELPVEELLDRSESSSSASTSSSASGPTDSGSSFHPYKGLPTEDGTQRFGEYAGRLSDGLDLPMALDKPKDYAIQRSELYNESSSAEETTGGIFRAASGAACNKDLPGQKESMYSFCREIREIRQKSLHAALERNVGSGKDLELIKTYGLSLDRIKDFGGLTSRIGSIALDRLRAAPLHGENSPVLEPEDLKSLQQLQSRVPATSQVEATMAFERLRHAHPLFPSDGQAVATQFHHSQQHHHPQQAQHHHHAITQITQMQHLDSHHQQHQQQAKSFTIDAILGLRGANQRDKHQRHHTYRKQHQGQEGTSKNLSTSSCSNGTNNVNNTSGAGGKLKRVRTIFTAEQLERLEGEFARQQYMVGPERLYLAHALRLTEAQVKVWFQNRRIKWRKLNHEQQSQRLHELHQNTMSAAERDDSNENATDW